MRGRADRESGRARPRASATVVPRFATTRLLAFRSQKQSTARDPQDRVEFFRVTHPFHPLFGREFSLVDLRNTWGEDRVYFHDATGELRRLPTAWTSVTTPSAFETVSAGRSHFRTTDLLQLAALIARQREVQPTVRRAKRPRTVSSK